MDIQGLTPYEKKKYVWKMLYIYMLGYDVDFGHMETVALISAPKYAEKQVLQDLCGDGLSPPAPLQRPFSAYEFAAQSVKHLASEGDL